MNVSMWLKALRVIPRLDRSEWQKLDLISRWLVSTRAAVLVMTFISAAVAGLLAARDGSFDFGRWLLLVIGLVFAHATNNLLNDYTDFKRGVDKDNYFRTQYGPQPLEAGLMSQRELLTYAAVTGLVAAAAGLPLVIFAGWPALLLMLAGVVFVLFYTWPLKYIGLGEISVLLIWGPLMVGGGYLVITGQWSWNAALASLAYALGPTTVIFGKHIDKLSQDQEKEIHTLPVLIGERAARVAVLAMVALQYILVVSFVLLQFLPSYSLLSLFALYTLPRVWRTFRKPKPAEKPLGLREGIWPLWFSAVAFYQNRSFGLLLITGLLLGVIFR